MKRFVFIVLISCISGYIFPARCHAAANLVFSDGFESGLGNWSLFIDTVHSLSSEYAHGGTYSHRVSYSGSPNSTARLGFTNPGTNKLFIRFYWLISDVDNAPGKIGRLKAAGGDQTVQMELWYASDSYSTGIYWYSSGCSSLSEQAAARYPANNINAQNVWHKYELFIEYNDNNLSNGRLRQWINRPEGTAFPDADGYKTIDVQNAQFKNTDCNAFYETFDLPTGFNDVGGYYYFDDVEIWDDLPTQSLSENCSDGIQNQDETGIDCGGICGACSDVTPPYIPGGVSVK